MLLRQQGLAVWYDMDAGDLTETGMRAAVQQSRSVLLFLSDQVMSSQWCWQEQRWGLEFGCNFVGVKEDDPRHGQANIALELERAPADLEFLLAEIEFLPYRRRNYEVDAMVTQLMLLLRPQL
jgi:hypothetical protein